MVAIGANKVIGLEASEICGKRYEILASLSLLYNFNHKGLVTTY